MRKKPRRPASRGRERNGAPVRHESSACFPALIRANALPATFRNSALKLHQDSSAALNTVTGYGADYVEINLVRHNGSILVLPEDPVVAWPVDAFDALTPELFDMLLPLKPEVVVFGSGSRLRFPHPRLTAALAARRIGVEAMDFKAACRTYNILMAEGRRVAAALLIES